MGEAALALESAAPSRSCAAAPPRWLAERLGRVQPPRFWPVFAGKPPLTSLEQAGLLRLADSIPGEASDAEIIALMEAMRHAPAGDVVELGAAAPRMAALLVWLARRYHLGPVLCLGDWSEEQRAEFDVDLAPLAEGGLNHLPVAQAPSYRPGVVVSTPSFGETRYGGRIAFVRCAGRHATSVARLTQHVAPGGWIVAGPDANAVGLDLVERLGPRIGARFEVAGALFLQLKR